MTARDIVMGAAGAASTDKTYIEDVFSTYLYTGNGTSQNINNGIDLGGLPVARVVATFYGAATTHTFAAEAGDILVGYVLGTSGSATLTLNGASKTAKSGLVDPLTYTNGVFIEPLVAGSNSFTAGSVGSGYGTFIVIRGASSVTVGKNLTSWSNSATSATTDAFASTGFGLILTSDRDSAATPTISGSYTVADQTYTYFKSRFFAVNGDSSTIPSQTITGLVGTYAGAYCGISVVGLGSSVPQVEAGKGGMVWIKARNYDSGLSAVLDTTRGATKRLSTNLTDAEYTNSTGVGITSFNSNGFSLGTGSAYNSAYNYASWTFRKAPKFFDVVTYTGNGATSRSITHNLGIAPGMVIVKRTDSLGDWKVRHRSIGSQGGLLNSTVAFGTAYSASGDPFYQGYISNSSATTFSVGGVYNGVEQVNASGATYVAYLFAHDTTTDGLIQCGSFTTDGSGNATVNLGWEPQYVMVKNTTSTGNWFVVDSMRGMPVSGVCNFLLPNTSGSESSGYVLSPTATGFGVITYAASQTYIYMAIRRGPMKTPTDGTKVFSPISTSVSYNTQVTTGFAVDTQIAKYRNSISGNYFMDRIRGVGTDTSDPYNPVLRSDSTSGETSTIQVAKYWNNTGFQNSSAFGSTSTIFYNFQRAPGFFDVVCYTGTGVARTVNHNLGVAPELMIVKQRSAVSDWTVWQKDVVQTDPLKVLNLQNNQAAFQVSNGFGSVTSTGFSVGTFTYLNANAGTYVAYLFASCPGVSKVGSYTGNGSSQTINCGFASGARFVLIKRTDSTGDWYVWDTARGIVAGNDPHLSLNSTSAEVTSNDTIDPESTGFIVNQLAATNVNVSGGSYIYLAIA